MPPTRSRLRPVARAFWSATSGTWDDALADGAVRDDIEELADWLTDATEKGAVVDLGCGTGNHSAALAERGWRACGVDSSPGMLRHAAAKSAVVLVSADLSRTLPFANGAFDAAVSVYSAQFLDLEPFLVEVRRVVRRGGRVLIELPAPRKSRRRPVGMLSWRYRLFRKFKDAVAAIGSIAGAVRAHSPDQLDAALRATGFDELEARSTDYSFAILARAR